jgi:beta-glucosidase
VLIYQVTSRYGTYSVDQAMKAGLDLEMPGPPRWRTTTLINQSLSAQKLRAKDIETRAEKLLTFVQKLGKANPDVVYGDGVERSRDSPELRQFCRRLTSDTMVLLKNRDNVLPLRREKVKKVALIGPHLKAAVISGGGSAALKPTYVVTPYDGITNGAPEGTKFSYALGCYGAFSFCESRCTLSDVRAYSASVSPHH